MSPVPRHCGYCSSLLKVSTIYSDKDFSKLRHVLLCPICDAPGWSPPKHLDTDAISCAAGKEHGDE